MRSNDGRLSTASAAAVAALVGAVSTSAWLWWAVCVCDQRLIFAGLLAIRMATHAICAVASDLLMLLVHLVRLMAIGTTVTGCIAARMAGGAIPICILVVDGKSVAKAGSAKGIG